MPKLIIDNREVTVPEGTNVLEAARALDIVIPHFCYHEALGAVGSCRLCAMKFVAGPVSGVQMACMIEAQDGMVVSTLDDEAIELRSHVIEWAMTSHPHDCPVCDEGGECQLQDMTVAGGHSLRRYRGKKQTYNNQDLGPFIQQEMNRCITCYRCVRTYRDYCGGSDFGVFGSRNRVCFGRFREGRLESPFSGNLVDVCPTGVFTNKTFRFKSRIWDLQEAPSICPHCSLGCSTIPGGRYRQLQRVRAGVNRQTNGFFICDRGRFGYDHANHPDRPRQARADGKYVSIGTAITAAERRIREIADRHGPDSIAFLGSSRASLEANALLGLWAARIGSKNLLFEAHRERDRATRILAARLGDRSCSLAELQQSDLLLVVGADPLAEGPLAALAIRQAARSGGRVLVIDPRPVEMPCRYEHLPVDPARLPEILQALAAGETGALPEMERSVLQPLFQELEDAAAPVLLGGVDLLGSLGINLLLDAAEALSSAERRVGVMALLGGPNSYGGALLTKTPQDFDALIDAIQEGTIKGLVCLESDPYRDPFDPARAQTALGHLDLLVALDCTPGLAAHRADIFLPSRVVAEMDGSFVNNEGRLQAFRQVFEPGLPIRETGAGGHPPREFSIDTPGAAPAPAWQILAQVLGIRDDLLAVRLQISEWDSRLRALPELTAEGTGIRLSEPAELLRAAVDELPHCVAQDTLQLLPVQGFTGSDWLAHLSSPLRALEGEPTVWVHPDLAAMLGLAEHDRARLTTALGHCRVSIRTAERMAPDLVLVPHLWDSAIEGMVPGGHRLDCRLEKEISL
jgi:NADH-quinone oxidoreductase subunit G